MTTESEEPPFILMEECKNIFVKAHRWRNPDGSKGGWTADSAHVDPSAIIDIDAMVFPGAIVGPGMKVGPNCRMYRGYTWPTLHRHFDP